MSSGTPNSGGLQSEAYQVQDELRDINTRLSRIEGKVGSMGVVMVVVPVATALIGALIISLVNLIVALNLK